MALSIIYGFVFDYDLKKKQHLIIIYMYRGKIFFLRQQQRRRSACTSFRSDQRDGHCCSVQSEWRHEKTFFRNFRPGPTQNGMCGYRR